MKHLLLFALLILSSFSPVMGNAKATTVAPDYIVIEDNLIMLTADVYMDASSVSVVLLDVNGSVQASAVTTPGRTVTFTGNDASQKVRSTYNLGAAGYVVIEDAVMY